MRFNIKSGLKYQILSSKGVGKLGCLSPMPIYHKFQLIEFLRARKNDSRVSERLK